MASEYQAPPLVTVNPWLIVVAVMLATFMEVLDTSIAAVAVPYIGGSLSASNEQATWVLTSYLVANAIVLPASGWFSLRFGRKRFLLVCIVIFTIASFAVGASTSLAMILFARALQGAGGGALQPVSQAIILESFPPEQRGLGMAAFGFGVVVAPVLGPTLGGWITETYTWRWAFFINIPIGILAVLLISRFVNDPPHIRSAKPGKLDGIGLGLLALWIGTLQIVLDKGQEDDWLGATWIRVAVVIIIVGFVAFLWREIKARKPLITLGAFADRNFAIGCLQIALFGGVVYGMVTILPLFFQTLLGYTALSAGFAVAPRGVGAIFAMPLVGFLMSKVDSRRLIGIGFAGVGVCNLWLGRVTLQISPGTMFWAILMSGFFLGFVFVPLATVAMGTLPDVQLGNASGIYNLFRNLGGSVGISLVNTIVARHAQLHRTELSHSLDPGSPVFHDAFAAAQRILTLHVGAPDAVPRALKLLEGVLNQQAALWSYVDDFRYLALASFATIPIGLALKRIARGKRVAAE
ncbi:MAG TPA: DHA2 family efflux MFS transporter permease subunit [Candidatus Limnocylindrales bacterium]|nr:DHA2 family efflux MFS transporter permease subunit [Candidatus Limnocylindrales bacterium]